MKIGPYIAVLSLISVSTFLGCKQEQQSPNIILIVVDDLGIADLGCYGQQYIETPNIDRMAAEGIRWKNAYASCPVCSPTRASILTGKYPPRIHFTGHITAIGRHRHPDNSTIIPPEDQMHISLEELIIPEALRDAGYYTGSFGKWHVGMEGYWPVDQGFDENVGGWTHGSPPSYFYPYTRPGSNWNGSIPTLEGGKEGEYLPDRLTDEAINFMQANSAQPFFVYLSYYAVHTPLQAPADLTEKYTDIVEKSGVDPVYAAMVDRVDWNVGRVLNFIEKQGLDQQTIVILTSDNGALETVTDNSPYRRGKGHLYDGGIRIPLIVRWPGEIDAGKTSLNRCISPDLYPTILELAGVQCDTLHHIDGRSLTGDFTGETLAEQPELFWYYPHYGIGQDPGAMIISGDYKLIKHFDPEYQELFNLIEDPGETEDLSSLYPAVCDQLWSDYMEWLKGTDPIMHTPNQINTQRK